MSENNGVIILRSYYEAIKTLSKREQNIMYSAIFEYVFDQKWPDLPQKLLPIWTLIRPNLDASAKRYNANKSNGIKGGRPRMDADKKTQLKNPSNKPTPFIDKEKEKEKDKEKDIYISAAADAEQSSDIYMLPPAALLNSLSEEEREQLEELCGDKLGYLMESVRAWLAAGHKTKSVYNTCLTFIRNNAKEFKGRPVQPDPEGPSSYIIEDEIVYHTGSDGYDEAQVIQYKVYKDGRREKLC